MRGIRFSMKCSCIQVRTSKGGCRSRRRNPCFRGGKEAGGLVSPFPRPYESRSGADICAGPEQTLPPEGGCGLWAAEDCSCWANTRQASPAKYIRYFLYFEQYLQPKNFPAFCLAAQCAVIWGTALACSAWGHRTEKG